MVNSMNSILPNPALVDSPSGLGRATLQRLAVGVALLLSGLWLFAPELRWSTTAALITLFSLGIATFLRGFELRAWFGRGLSMHQSQSLQLVLDLIRWASPLQDRRRLEVEFVARETSRSSDAVSAWSRGRQRWRIVLLAALPTLVATFILPNPFVAVPGWIVVALGAALTSPHWRQTRLDTRRIMLRSHAEMFVCALGALAIETLAIATAASMLVPDPATAAVGAAVVFITLGLVRAVPATPFGVGTFEVVALSALWLAGAMSLASLVLLVHATWIVIALLLGVPYLSRYKLTFRDLFDRRLATLLSQSRRPDGGWPEDGSTGAQVELTVAIPAYNERERLPQYLPQVMEYLAGQDYTWEIVVADDGSIDGTGEYVKGLAKRQPRLRLVRRESNGGKGRAVLDAIEAARGRYVLIADADGATPIGELAALRAAVAEGAEIAIGSRVAHREGRVRERDALRAVIGKVFYGLVNFLAVPGIGDTQCGFKLLRIDVARGLFRELGEFGWAFDVEVLYRAQLAGYRVAEVAVDWHEVAGSKLRPFRDATRMLLSLFRIRARNAGFTSATGQALLADRISPSAGDAA
jgi:dolichyl-phosphate beta-glucosyltransferase